MWATAKNVVIAILLVVVAVGVWRYFTAWGDGEKRIQEAQTARVTLQKDKETLEAKVRDLSGQQQQKDKAIAIAKQEIAEREDQITTLIQDLEVANQRAVTETGDQAIASDFKRAFELTDENVKVISYQEQTKSGRVFTNVFLAMPVDVAKLAILSKNTEVACKQEVGLREQIDALNTRVIELTNEKLDLEMQKTQAWSDGYQEAYAMYIDINKLYVDLLKAPPKVDLAPRWLQLTGGLVLGAALCSL